MAKKYENLTREMEFILAMKPFIDEESHGKVDSLLEMMSAIEVMKKASKGLNFQSVNRPALVRPWIMSAEDRDLNLEASDDSIHPDGIYDVDKKCIAAKNRSLAFNNYMPLLAALFLKPNI